MDRCRIVRATIFERHSSEIEFRSILSGNETAREVEISKFLARVIYTPTSKKRSNSINVNRYQSINQSIVLEHKSLWFFRLKREREKLKLFWMKLVVIHFYSSPLLLLLLLLPLRFYMATRQGNLEMVKYCVAKKCPIDDKWACARAAQNGHLEVLKYFREEVKAPWDFLTAAWAATNGHLHILEYLVERKYDGYDERACAFAAENGHLDCLKYLHETAEAPWDEEAVRKAHENNQPECVQYLLDNNCPLPFGWRYEDGILRTPTSSSS